jgi:hypothetical protein
VLIDVVDPSASYVYVWTELAVWPVEFGRVGLALQRTRAWGEGLYAQPGFFVGLTDSVLDAAFYVFDLGIRPPTLLVSVTVYR